MKTSFKKATKGFLKSLSGISYLTHTGYLSWRILSDRYVLIHPPAQCEQAYVHCCISLQELLRFKTFHITPVRSRSHLDPVVVASNLQIRGYIACFAPTKLFRPGLDCFIKLFNTGRSTFYNGAEQSCSEKYLFQYVSKSGIVLTRPKLHDHRV